MKQVARLVVVGAFALLAGCDQSPNAGSDKKAAVANVTQLTKEEQVAKRALERMQALIELDWKRAYQYLSPATRKVMPYHLFASQMGGAVIVRDAARVESVQCEKEVCKVHIALTYTYVGGIVEGMQGKQLSRTVKETWVYSDGGWWYVMP